MAHSHRLLVLSARELERLVGMEEAIEAVREGFVELSAGRVAAPRRLHLPIQAAAGTGLVMPAYGERFQAISLKMANIFPENPTRFGLPTTVGLLMLFDGQTGRPLAVMDAEYLTALRTGAASGLATRLLAREDSQTVALFGTGRQARFQLLGILAARPVERVVVFSRTLEGARRFVREMSPQVQARLVATDDLARLAEADIVCTATTASQPLFPPRAIKEGAHINAVGSFRPDMVEIPPELLAESRLFVDCREACLAEAGEVIAALKAGFITREQIQGELGELAAGQIEGRTRAETLTVFKSVGHAVQDLAVATLAYRKAREKGVGEEVHL